MLSNLIIIGSVGAVGGVFDALTISRLKRKEWPGALASGIPGTMLTSLFFTVVGIVS